MNTTDTHTPSVTRASFSTQVLAASHVQPVLVDFWAAWCGPCKAMNGPLHEIATERAGRLAVVKVDVDAEPELAADLHIRSIPTLVLFRDGRVVDTLVGLRPKADLLSHIDSVLGAASAGVLA
ncbi:MAG: thioredoxin [Opitutaceae bacterium]|nr:thioredoxin [Opitutaceae bacterium]